MQNERKVKTGGDRGFEDASMSSTEILGAFDSSLRGALRSAAGIRGRCSRSEPQYVDKR